ncbi:RNA polymerase III transcription factor IIIC subunit-domain-containing protein [Fimicolochytrium jonesii]|uniref:RNA polymerase III transcription factor IIIC subunit-domain-containing protein n=1 Tax=Fimicolochytrium jonesii TaxID=1396493 RepID=UPI0022FF1F26|nr:RNA polymerase III transcription factor IIIC subunit-domain-containing protein [Fimicolochytrium jonesii]KAI8818977.1 RNA polymerase III transcription factor IIIC subunit-domain-containing protein [Fimicolochytrium jonesii]
MATDGSDYERAPSQTLPSWKFHAVEYPGYVKNFDNVLKTLGGSEAIEKAFANDLNVVELRYRPEDPFSHPINGEIIQTSNILLGVTIRRKRKRTGSAAGAQEPVDPSQITTRFMGTITKTCRFRAIADYQWTPDPHDPLVKLRRDMQVLDIEGIEKFVPARDRGPQENLRNMPPPAFSRIEWPFDYGYRQNIAVVKVLVRKEGQSPQMKLLNRYESVKFTAVFADASKRIVPTKPPKTASLAGIPAEALTLMQQLFEQRPCWTRLAITNNLPARYRPLIKKLLPLYAYSYMAGPWRDTWLRYGYDPWNDKEARFSQIIDLRFMKPTKAASSLRAKRLIGVMEPSHLVVKRTLGPTAQDLAADRAEDDPPAPDTHIFDGIRTRDTGTFTLNDITDPDIIPLINTTRRLRSRCHDRDGWFRKGHIDLIRDLMKRKMKVALGKIPSFEFHWDDNEGDSEPDIPSDDERTTPNVMEVEMMADAGAGLSEETQDKVKSKVGELMKSLQAAQMGENAVEEDQDETDQHEDDADFDYYDAFGDDDEDEDI